MMDLWVYGLTSIIKYLSIWIDDDLCIFGVVHSWIYGCMYLYVYVYIFFFIYLFMYLFIYGFVYLMDV